MLLSNIPNLIHINVWCVLRNHKKGDKNGWNSTLMQAFTHKNQRPHRK